MQHPVEFSLVNLLKRRDPYLKLGIKRGSYEAKL